MEVFYLKLNRGDGFSWQYADIWMEAISALKDPYVYFVVDQEYLKDHLQRWFDFHGVPHEIIGSARNSLELQSIVHNFAPNWRNAGYAHGTTFLHARDHGFDNFWNIDIDDITLYVKPARFVEILNTVKSYAGKNNVHAFSLDCWYTVTNASHNASHWSFGVTYIRNSVNWLEIMKRNCGDEFKKFVPGNVRSFTNVDWLFTYLRAINQVNIETFCVENLYAIMNNVGNPYTDVLSSMRYWHEGGLYFPLIVRDFGMGDIGRLQMPNDVIKFDIGLTEEEAMERFREIALTRAGSGWFNIFWREFKQPPPPAHTQTTQIFTKNEKQKDSFVLELDTSIWGKKV